MPNKYHEALEVAVQVLYADMNNHDTYSSLVMRNAKAINRLIELKNVLKDIRQLKQSLKELDLEESK